MKARKIKEKTLYTVAPLHELWMGYFDNVKEFKTKSKTLAYAKELIDKGNKQVHFGIDYFLGTDLLKTETGVYKDNKLKIIDSFAR